jgi:hypothetical protein
LLEATEVTLDEIEGVGIVHSRFYLLLSELAQKEADYKGYYRYCPKDRDQEPITQIYMTPFEIA